MRKRFNRVIAVLISLAVLFTSLGIKPDVLRISASEVPVPAEIPEDILMPGTESNDNSDLAPTIATDQLGESYAINEISLKRDINIKHFMLSDRSLCAVAYYEPVHFFNAAGEWQDIDSTLNFEKNEYKTKAGYTTVAYDANAVAINVTDGKNPVSWKLINEKQNKVTAKLMEMENSKELGLIDIAVSKVRSGLCYENIFDNVSLEYINNGYDVKESIVIKKPGSYSSYVFEYDTGHLALKARGDGALSLINPENGEEIYSLAAPYMYDKNGAIGSVKYQIEEIKSENKAENQHAYKVTVIADQSWLDDKTREYPVVIDPTIIANATRRSVTTQSAFVGSLVANTPQNTTTHAELVVGRQIQYYGICRSVLKFVLPTLDEGDVVVDAKMHLTTMDNYGFYNGSTPDVQINVHALSGNWDRSTVTWNNCPNFDTTVLDYNYIRRPVQAGKSRYWDLTKLVKKWYDGSVANNGIILKAADEDLLANNIAYAANETYVSERNAANGAASYPKLILTYRNNIGLEDYWTYTSVDLGKTGTLYVNDYSGRLTFVAGGVSTTGLLAPVSVHPVYTGDEWKFNLYCKVARTSFEDSSATTNFPYVYTDEDGTEHYFYRAVMGSTVKYCDEDGLGLEITEYSGTSYKYIIKDSKDNKLYFNTSGILYRISDADGNSINVSFDSAGRPTSITDGSGHTLTGAFSVISTGRGRYTLTDPAGRNTIYSYFQNTNGKWMLESVQYPDGKTDTIAYTLDKKIEAVTSYDAHKVLISRASDASGKQYVSRIETQVDNSDWRTDEVLTFSRSRFNEVDITSAGNDGNINTAADNVTSTLQFDNYGRTVTVQTTTQNADYGTTIYDYTGDMAGNTGANAKKVNHISSVGYTSGNPVNYIENGGIERTGDWWGYSSSSYAFAYTGTEVFQGKMAGKITVTTASNGSNLQMFHEVPTTNVAVNRTYTFSAYVKTENLVSNGSAYYGAGLFVGLYNASGSLIQSWVSNDTALNPKTESLCDNGFERLSLNVTPTSIPSGTFFRAGVFVKNATGVVYIDNFQFEEGNTAGNTNLLENAGFELLDTSGNNKPKHWIAGSNLAGNMAQYGYIQTTGYSKSGKAVYINGNAAAERYLSQTINIKDAKPGESYIFGGWVKANAVTLNPTNADVLTGSAKRQFNLAARVYDADNRGSGNANDLLVIKNFNTAVDGWQYVEGIIAIPDKGAGWKPDTITIYLNYSYEEGTAYFDNVFLVKDNASAYTYDANGNVTSVAEDAENKSTYGYSNGNLTSGTAANGYGYSYTYDTKHHMLTASASNGNTYSYVYDTYGNAKELEIRGSGTNPALIKTKASYGSYGTYISATSDADAYTTYHNYNYTTGVLNSIQSPVGAISTYSYNSQNDLLTNASHSVKNISGTTLSNTGKTAVVNYTYNSNGYVTKIATAKSSYAYNYDKYGRITTIETVSAATAGNTLITNAYDANTGRLTRTNLADVCYFDYTYDEIGRHISTSENGSTIELYVYDKTGKLSRFVDLKEGSTYNYLYDSTNRLVKVEKTGNNAYKLYNDYDTANNTATRLLIINGSRYSYNASYNSSSLLSSYTISKNGSTTANFTYSYDTLGRLTSESKTIGSHNFVNSYTYAASNRGGNYTTTKIATETVGSYRYRYEYDKLGNITKVYRVYSSGNETLWYSYEYDSLSELIRTNDYYMGNTYVYTYDAAGNLICKDRYPYSTAASTSYTKTINGASVTTIRPGSLTPSKTYTYTYGLGTGTVATNGINADALTSYDGKSITYDALGNPVTYMGNTLTWSGKNLTSYTSADGKIHATYTYDAGGVRTGKQVSENKGTYTKNTVYYYTYQGSTLIYEKRVETKSNSSLTTTQEYYYIYSGLGTLAEVEHTETVTGGTAAQNRTSTAKFAIGVNSRGDVEQIRYTNGSWHAEYIYDAYGKIKEFNDDYDEDVVAEYAQDNAVKYRGYYQDSETGLYYCIGRYYDAETGRFISADYYTSTGQGFFGYNMYAYCGNNPVMRADSQGEFWETVLDVASLCVSIAEVCVNPADPWAWIGLAGDIVDLVPFVTGAGETVRFIKVTMKTADKVDDAVDSVKLVNEARKNIKMLDNYEDIAKSTGSYLVRYSDNMVYSGKGGIERAFHSAKRYLNSSPEVSEIYWKSAKNGDIAFMEEYLVQNNIYKELPGKIGYNKYWSPGKKYYSDYKK